MARNGFLLLVAAAFVAVTFQQGKIRSNKKKQMKT